MRPPWTALALAIILPAWVLVGAEPSPPPPASPAGECEPDHVVGLGNACQRADGFYEVHLADGRILVSHGPDPELPDVGVGFGPGSDERNPVCANEWRMHVLYGYPAGGNNRYAQVVDPIKAHMRRTNAVLNADAMETGNVNADYKIACDAAGDILVDVFTGPSGSTDFDAIVNAATNAGYRAPHTDYVIFYDGTATGICGVGHFSGDDSLSSNNANLAGPDYGVTYSNCWYSRTPMHENGHNQGAVQMLAPMSDLNGHCLEGYDVMCYTSNYIVLCGDRVHFDCRHDTYFHANPPATSWLASNWNIGSRLNKYIAFSDQPGESNPTPTPSPSPTTSSTTSSSTTESSSKSPTTTSKSKSKTTTRKSSPRTTLEETTLEGSSTDAAPLEGRQSRVPGPLALATLAALATVPILLRRRR